VEEEIIPLVGFNTNLSNYKAGQQIEKILERENVNIADFKIKSMPELSCEGSERERVSRAEGLGWKFEDDEMNGGKIKCVLRFGIPKGSYATALLNEALEVK